MISIIIPTYTNHDQLLANLRHNIRYLADEEIIVVNDNPDRSLNNELKQWKNVKLIEHKKNEGFARSINDAAKLASNDILMLLNDDVLLKDNGYEHAARLFNSHKNLFSISFSQKEKNGRIVGKNRLFWKRDFIHHSAVPDTSKAGNNAWAEGGSCLIRHDLFNKFNGMDPDYSPFYWEDIDLSYRAWKSGYVVLFDPSVTVIHHHESTIGTQFKKEYVRSIAYRNQFLFIWKNITDTKLILSHILMLPVNLMYYAIKGEFAFVKGFYLALSFLPRIKRRTALMSDKEVLQNFVE